MNKKLLNDIENELKIQWGDGYISFWKKVINHKPILNTINDFFNDGMSVEEITEFLCDNSEMILSDMVKSKRL